LKVVYKLHILFNPYIIGMVEKLRLVTRIKIRKVLKKVGKKNLWSNNFIR